MSFIKWMSGGSSSSNSESNLASVQWPDNNDRFYGLVNLGNICYCNSILQTLYFCRPFRHCVLNFPPDPSRPPLLRNGGSLQSHPLQTGGRALATNHSSLVKHVPPPGEDSLPAKNGLLKKERKRRQNTFKLLKNKIDRSADASDRPSLAASAPVIATMATTAAISPADHNNGATSDPARNLAADSMALNSVLRHNIPDSMFSALKDLFTEINSRVPRSGVLTPFKFISKLKASNELFRSNAHQDAHEFLNYLLNEISENVSEIQRRKDIKFGCRPDSDSDYEHRFVGDTWVHMLFEGLLANETKCLTCEDVTSREETFLDISVEVYDNSSVSKCLARFVEGEMLNHNNKFYCDNCGGLQEAERRMRIKRLPNILALHLKRFKYHETLGRYIKLSYRVNFPIELRIPDMEEEADDILYYLFGIVIHLGGGPFHGHYISIVRSDDKWVLFDDDCIEIVDESELYNYFGDLPSYGSGYVLFYERSDFDPSIYNLPIPSPSLPPTMPAGIKRGESKVCAPASVAHAKTRLQAV